MATELTGCDKNRYHTKRAVAFRCYGIGNLDDEMYLSTRLSKTPEIEAATKLQLNSFFREIMS